MNSSPLNVEFPITGYDRPNIALANLASGNVDAATRAIFSPMTLSPEESKNIRQRFLRGTDNHPIMKTILDVATNPIVVIGLMMSVGPWGKVANPAQLSKIWSGLAGAQKEINPMMRALSSSFTSLRSIWHLEVEKGLNTLNSLIEFATRTAKFESQGLHTIERAEKAFQLAAGKELTRTQRFLAYMWNDGMHNLPATRMVGGEETIIKAPFQAYYKKLFGTNAPLMPQLEEIMNKENPALLKYAKSIQKMWKRQGKLVFTRDASGEMHDQLLAKGITLIEDYAPRTIGYTDMEKFLTGSPVFSIKESKGIIRRIGETGFLGSHAKERIGNTIPDMLEMTDARNEILKKHGLDLFGSGMWDKFQKVKEVQVQNVEKLFGDVVTLLQKNKIGTDWHITETGDFIGPDAKAPEQVAKVLGDSWKILAKQFGLMRGQKDWKVGAAKLTSALQRIAALPPEMSKQELSGIARVVGSPGEYTMDIAKVSREYVHAMAPTYAWWKPYGREVIKSGTTNTVKRGKSLGKAFLDVIDNIEKIDPNVKDADWLRRYVRDDLAPTLSGLKTFKEMARSQTFRDTALKLNDWLRESPMAKALPDRVRQKMITSLNGARGGLTDSSVGRQISGLMYTSALGLNLSPVSKNLMQPTLQSMEILGPGNFLLGVKRTLAGMPKFMATLKNEGMERAVREAWPEYYKAFRGEGIVKAAAGGDVAAEQSALLNAAKGVFDKAKQIAMIPFGVSEKWNRLISFYGAHDAMLASGQSKKVAQQFATQFNMYFNYTGGPLGIPNWARGTWAPFRQFGHFPSRMVESLYGAMRMGPEGQFTTGMLGRSLATSAGVYTIAKNLMKIDPSAGLILNALPGPVYERSSFYPAPYVPPIIGAAGDVMKAFHSGDFSQLPRTASLFVPGGLGMSRMWRNWSPKYADYTTRTQDGRIPIYNDQGALIKTMTPGQLALKGLGIQTVEQSAEPQMVQYLLKQRDQIRGYRRMYLEALGDNDLEKAQKINKEFSRKYPQLGQLQVKKADIRAMQNRKETIRLERAVKGFPKDYQPIFQELVNYNGLNQMSEMIDNSPDSLQAYLQ